MCQPIGFQKPWMQSTLYGMYITRRRSHTLSILGGQALAGGRASKPLCSPPKIYLSTLSGRRLRCTRDGWRVRCRLLNICCRRNLDCKCRIGFRSWNIANQCRSTPRSAGIEVSDSDNKAYNTLSADLVLKALLKKSAD